VPSNNVAEIVLTASYTALAAALAAAGNLVKSFASGAQASIQKMSLAPQNPNKGSSWLPHAVGQVAGNLAMRGIDKLVDEGKAVFDFERKLQRFGIAAKWTDTQLEGLRKATRETSVATGQDATEVLNAARAYADLAGASAASTDKMRVLARVGQASEASGADLAGMMYQLTRSMKVADDQMEDTMGGLINQAKEGAIEAKQMAAEFSGMMPIFARFGVVGREGAVQLGAMYQVTRDGFDSASQAATGMIRLMAGFQRHASRFAEGGVQVFKPGSKKELRDLSDIMEQVKRSPLNKDIEALIKAFGRSEAWRTFELLAEAPERLKELEQAGRANGVVQQDLQRYLASTSGQMDLAMQKVKNAFAEALTPDRIAQIVSGITQMADAIGPLMRSVSFVADGFERFLGLVQHTKRSLAGDNAKIIPNEKQANDLWRLRAENEGRRNITWEPGEKEKALKFKREMDEHNRQVDKIRALEDGFGPTDASIKEAIRLRHLNEGPGYGAPGDFAGTKYLEGEGVDVNSPRFKRLEQQVTDQEKKIKEGMSPFGFDPTEKFKAKRDAAQQAVNESVKLLSGLGQQIGRHVAAAVGVKDTVVHIDGNPVAKAAKEATDARRK
jgi:TP901 family phage tail tape measure protein